MSTATVPALSEVRRLRAELADLHRLVADLIAADPGPMIPLDEALRWAADARQDEHERAWSQGYIAAVEDWKRSEVLAIESGYLVALHFRSIRWPQWGEGK